MKQNKNTPNSPPKKEVFLLQTPGNNQTPTITIQTSLHLKASERPINDGTYKSAQFPPK